LIYAGSSGAHKLRIPPASVAFTLLLGLLVSLPAFGIDMNLPALAATAATFGVTPSRVGLAMSVFMLGFAVAPLVYGPASDRYGRKPIVMFGCILFAIAGVGCAASRSLLVLLLWRIVQGAGAGASVTIVLAIIRDLFEGQAARTRFSYVAVATMTVPMIAPTVGAALLELGSWRLIYGTLAAVGFLLLLVILLGFTESARLDPANRLAPAVVLRNYRRALTHPACVAYILVNATAFGALFAYVSGSPLFFINVLRLKPNQYGMVFAATSLSIMLGAFINGRLSARNVRHEFPLTGGLLLAAASAMILLTMTLAAWMPFGIVIAILAVNNFAFGLIAPNAMQGVMHPLPQIAGAVSAMTGFVQMTVAAIVSGLVTTLFDGRSALSMTSLMAVCSLLALAGYLVLARPAESAIEEKMAG
jgi:MFS transporter, DHA1 family, multidrug resistance protein